MPDNTIGTDLQPDSDLLFQYEGQNTSAALGKALRDQLAAAISNARNPRN